MRPLFANRWSSKPPYPVPMDTNHPIAQGVVGAWFFVEDEGTLTDDCSPIRSQKGTLQNGASWANGPFGPVIKFDRSVVSTDAVDIGLSINTALNLPNEMSLATWCMVTSGFPLFGYLAADSDSSFSNSQWSFYVNNSTGAFSFNGSGGGGNGQVTTNFASLDVWVFVVMTQSGSSGNWIENAYINGVFDNSLANSGTTSSQGGAAIGRAGNYVASSGFNGYIDGFVLWNRALSAAEVAQLYAQGYWQMLRPQMRRGIFSKRVPFNLDPLIFASGM